MVLSAAARSKHGEDKPHGFRGPRRDGKVSHNKFRKKTSAGVCAIHEGDADDLNHEEPPSGSGDEVEAATVKEDFEPADPDENEVSPDKDGSHAADEDVESTLEVYSQWLKAKKKLRGWGFQEAVAWTF